jgi:15-cis-phytoene synthase
MDVSLAYQQCEEITAREAKNFSYGIRLLPTPKRKAMSAIYALARRIDDIGDGNLSPGEKLTGLAEVRKQIADLPGEADDAVLVALHDATSRYQLPLEEFGELIDGCEMDVTGTTYATFDDLVGYCRRVAGSIGRLSLAVFGTPYHESAEPRAEALGVALQVTNILRDVVEDRGMGRVYLPADDARRAGCEPDLSGPTEAVAALVAAEVPNAREWFARGLELLPLLDRRSRACVAAMAGIYRRLLDRIEHDPAAVLRGRISLPTREKLWVAARAITVGAA